MADGIAQNTNDSSGFAFDVLVALAEGGLVGTLSYIGVGALANLPVFLIPVASALPVGVVLGVVVAVKQLRQAWKNR